LAVSRMNHASGYSIATELNHEVLAIREALAVGQEGDNNE